MNEQVPTFAGWYPDTATGGTKYWDGSRWTGDARPPRRSFAAASGDRQTGLALATLSVSFPFMGVMILLDEQSGEAATSFLVMLVMGLFAAVASVYLIRGQGPSTRAVEERLKREQKAAKAKRRTANVAGAVAQVGRIVSPPSHLAPAAHDSSSAAQIKAITDPLTADALLNLQKLLYTRTITDAEYEAAKDKLFGTKAIADQFEQIEKLADLHRAGILGDVEFSAAKARVLGL